MSRHKGGGAAAAAGLDFQNRVAAWVATIILSERDVSAPWGLPSSVSPELLRCETEQPLDDLLVGTSAGGFAFFQIKRSLELSDRAESAFFSVVDQVVRQYLACKQSARGKQPWERPLDRQIDRLVLAVGPSTSAAIRQHLPAVLNRLREDSEAQLSTLPRNQEEARSWEFLLGVARQAWTKLENVEPEDAQLREVFGLLWIGDTDIEPGGSLEREAINSLRQAVLKDPGQANQAWALLVTACARMAANRSGASRPELQRLLLEQGIEVRVPHSYRKDVEKLKSYTLNTLESLKSLACIRVGEQEAQIPRDCTSQLLLAAVEGSLVVVGEPGSGKSGALHSLVDAARNERDVVFLAVDRLEAPTETALQLDLGIGHPFFEVLANWPGGSPALLVIDALDAARAERTARVLRDLIRRVIQSDSRWRVVAAIRKFDLQYSRELQALFPKQPVSEVFADPDFSGIRHINIPRLSEKELVQLLDQVPILARFVNAAPAQLRDLLFVPFNLRILGELVGAGVLSDHATPIRTQLELLNEYWQRRVVATDHHGDDREAILRRACDLMVTDRTLKVERVNVVSPQSGSALSDLLSAHVLAGWRPTAAAQPDRYILTFSHHVLFDYAVSRLFFSSDEDRFIAQLADDPELAVAFRQSIVLYLRRRWSVDQSRGYFWTLIIRLGSDVRVHHITHLIGPSVAADEVRSVTEVEELLGKLNEPDTIIKEVEERTLRHLVGAILTAHSTGTVLVGSTAGPWAEFVDRASRGLRRQVMYGMRPLLSVLCDDPSALTDEQRQHLGIAARRFLEYGWQNLKDDRWFCGFAIQAVCRTFESDPGRSGQLLARMLDQPHLAERGYYELTFLDREVERLIDRAPEFVELVYSAVFAYQHESKEKTSLGVSRILPLTSTEAQDYRSAWYQLGEIFPKFLAASPACATRALIRTLQYYTSRDHSSGFSSEVETFAFRGRTASVRSDLSVVWDGGGVYEHDDPVKMLEAFLKYLGKLATEQRGDVLDAVLDAVADRNQMAVLWKRLLSIGAECPAEVGARIKDLCFALPILAGVDTTREAGEFLAVMIPGMSASERTRVEELILAIPRDAVRHQPEFREVLRNRLLGCLPEASIVTTDARVLVEELRKAEQIHPNTPLVGRVETTWERFDARDYLASEGVPVEDAWNRQLLDLQDKVKPFGDAHRSKPPDSEALRGVVADLEAMEELLREGAERGAHTRLLNSVWATLAEACAIVPTAKSLEDNPEAATVARRILLSASHHPDPVFDQAIADQFDRHPSWGPAARISAAFGLTLFCRHPGYVTDDIREAVSRLVRDSVPAVRFQVAHVLNALYETDRAGMWEMLGHVCHNDNSPGVLDGAVGGPLARLAGVSPDSVSELLRQVLSRMADRVGAQEVRQSCAGIVTGLYLWRGHKLCGEMLSELLEQPEKKKEEVHRAIVETRGLLMHGSAEVSEPLQDEVRIRAVELLHRSLQSVLDALQNLQATHVGERFDQWPKDSQERGESLVQLADQVGMQVYFASGAYQGRTRDASGSEREPTQAEQVRFFNELRPTLSLLADVGLAPIAHHLLETLEVLVGCNPAEVFILVARVVRGAKTSGYQYESLAINLIVTLVERFLADHRVLFREDERCRNALLEVLDTFVDAGWPSARRLTYRLEEIWR